MIEDLEICKKCKDEYKGERCEEDCESWYCYLLNRKEEWRLKNKVYIYVNLKKRMSILYWRWYHE